MQLPASVLTYFSDRATRMATDLLLAQKRPTVPEDVKWDDLVPFYKASLAAKQIEAEFAILAYEIWVAVCEDMPSSWRRTKPHEQVKDCGVGLPTVWEERCHTREYFMGEFGCEIVICISKDEGIQVGYGLWFEGKPLSGQGAPQGWEISDEMCWSTEGAVPLAEVIDLARLRDFAEQGREYVVKLVAEQEQLGA